MVPTRGPLELAPECESARGRGVLTCARLVRVLVCASRCATRWARACSSSPPPSCAAAVLSRSSSSPPPPLPSSRDSHVIHPHNLFFCPGTWFSPKTRSSSAPLAAHPLIHPLKESTGSQLTMGRMAVRGRRRVLVDHGPARLDLLLHDRCVPQHGRVLKARESLNAPRLELSLATPVNHGVGALVVLRKVAQCARGLAPDRPVRVHAVAHVAEQHVRGIVKRALDDRLLGEVGEARAGEDLGGHLELSGHALLALLFEEFDECVDDAAFVHRHSVLLLRAEGRHRARRLEDGVDPARVDHIVEHFHVRLDLVLGWQAGRRHGRHLEAHQALRRRRAEGRLCRARLALGAHARLMQRRHRRAEEPLEGLRVAVVPFELDHVVVLHRPGKQPHREEDAHGVMRVAALPFGLVRLELGVDDTLRDERRVDRVHGGDLGIGAAERHDRMRVVLESVVRHELGHDEPRHVHRRALELRRGRRSGSRRALRVRRPQRRRQAEPARAVERRAARRQPVHARELRRDHGRAAREAAVCGLLWKREGRSCRTGGRAGLVRLANVVLVRVSLARELELGLARAHAQVREELLWGRLDGLGAAPRVRRPHPLEKFLILGAG
mmetsp:Transcript_15966/g.29028  ORF Transcript_15966/g.29028 Transcript_15966/m.29028 type:complete len:611 (+) Transcript_15966:335-2167(+)